MHTKADTSKYLIIPHNLDTSSQHRFIKLKELILDSIYKQDKSQLTIVDVGCSNGHFMKYVLESCPSDIKINFIGIDKFINEKCFDFQLISADIEDGIPLSNNCADIVICSEVIEHIRNTDTLIKELRRICTSDGDIFLSTPNMASYFNRFLLLLGYQPYHAEVSEEESSFGLGIIYKVLSRPTKGNVTAGHLRIFSYRALKDMVEYYNLKLVSYYPVYLSFFREDNTRVRIIRIFFLFDKVMTKIFPKTAIGMIFHLKK